MMDLENFDGPIDAAVIGASGGIGGALVRALAASPTVATVHALARRGQVPDAPGVRAATLDLADEGSIAEAVAAICADTVPRLVIVASGLLHDGDLQPEKSWRDLAAANFAQSYAVNAIGPALVAKHLLPHLPRRERAVFACLSARVGSISDNRTGGWYAYRASKAALNQILKCLAIEAARSRPQVVIAGLQPGTVATPLSAPFRTGVKREDLFHPDQTAQNLLQVLDGLQPAQSGGLFDWQGQEIPP